MNQETKNALAGLTSGMCTTAVFHPLDVVKTARQLLPSRDLVATIRQVPLYTGITPALIGSGAAWALYFTTAEWCNDALHLGGTLSGAVAGGLTSIITNPIWVVKTRMVGQPQRRLAAIVQQVVRDRAFLLGSGLSLVSVGVGAVQMGVYKHLRDRWKGRNHPDWITVVAASSIGKICAGTLFFPINTVRARVQAENQTVVPTIAKMWREAGGGASGGACTGTDSGFNAMWRSTVRKCGVFYAGLSANLARAVPATTMAFFVYEYVRANL